MLKNNPTILVTPQHLKYVMKSMVPFLLFFILIFLKILCFFIAKK